MPTQKPHELVDSLTAWDALVEKARHEVSRRHEDEVLRVAEIEKQAAIVRGVNVSRIPDFIRAQYRQKLNYIQTIKAVREMTGWGLKDAKDICDTIRAQCQQADVAREEMAQVDVARQAIQDIVSRVNGRNDR
jgi:ribosomal protein L7/L12